MVDQRVGWGELPARTRRAVVQRFGVLSSARTVPEGITCRTALVLTTATKNVFLKGVPVSDRQGVAAQRTEVRVNGAVRAVGPAVVWEAVAGGWHLVAFDHVDGRHADFAPGTADAGVVAELLGRTRQCQVPAGRGVPPLVERYGAVLGPGDAELLAGSALLHTDTNPHNILITARGGRLVDWAMPAVGPAWVDAANTAVRLMGFDWETREALAWLRAFPEWEGAARSARAAFVRVVTDDATARFGRYAAEENARFLALLATG
ncbi:phosphotransferase family protein [Kitasatospora purpeofusca]|uniref:phosphotransferase family protein n=1 Tax=Kitasatospora purpeofusca TaxID=67352 RepID=UPI0004BF4AF3|nr:phosphotransferase [Kitasatospora purpeofusca]